MTSEKQLQIFISHFVINQDVTNEFIDKFKYNHRNCEVTDEEHTNTTNFGQHLENQAQYCDIVILLISALFTAHVSKTNNAFSLFKRRKTIFVTVLLHECSSEEWNDKAEGNFLSFRIKKGDLMHTHREGHNAESYNKENIPYQQVDDRDKETFHIKLKEWIAEKYKEKTAINNKKDNDEKHKILKEMLANTVVSNLAFVMEEELRKEDTLLWQKLAIKVPSEKVSFAYWYSQRLIERLNEIDRKIEYCKNIDKIHNEFDKLVPIMTIFQTVYGSNYNESNPILVSSSAMQSTIENFTLQELEALKSIISCRIIELTRSLEKIKKETLLWR